jgi:poly(3-hydroxybutyrate) depolymerase
MKMTRFSTTPLALAAFLCTTAFAYNVSGTVKDEVGTPVQGANVTLVQKAKSTLTDAEGKFVLTDEPIDAIHAQKVGLGHISINDGVLDFSQNGNTPVKIRIFDMMGNQVLNHSLTGSGRLDLRQGVSAHGTYIARVRMGNAEQAVRFTASGSYSSALTGQKNGALYLIQQGKAGNLQVVANGFDSLNIYLPSLDTVLALTLKKSTAGSSPSSSPSSSSSGASSPSSSAITSSSSSAASLNPGEQTFAFGYALKNSPRPSKGCGKNSSLNSTGTVENGKKYNLNVGGKNRTFFITLPSNYDNNKAHKLLIANHCMGSKAEDFVHHNPDYDHPTPYYGQQKLDKNGDYIFVAPQGNDNGTWNGKEDHQFVDEMITAMFDNYCIDTTRVFATGFSFGAMFTNSLAQDLQERLRAVAVYATADYNIWLPSAGTGRYDAKNLPIAWMGVHGKNDQTCSYNTAKTSALPRILKRNGKADADGKFTDASSEKPTEVNGNSGHVCYDFTTVDERFPVKWCSWPGGHQWTAHDNGDMSVGAGWQETWVPEEVHKFLEQF